MNKELKDRALLPIAIPVGALIVIGAITFSISRILLRVPEQIATAIALMVAANILIVFSFLASRTKLTRIEILPLAGAALVPVLVGAAVAAGLVPVKEGHVGDAEPKVVEIAAKDLKFDTDTLEVPADEAFELEFSNQDSAPHNVWIVRSETSDETLFRKEFFTGPKTVTWRVPPIPAGTYFFRCEVHPDMKGTVNSKSDETAGGKNPQEEAAQVIVR